MKRSSHYARMTACLALCAAAAVAQSKVQVEAVETSPVEVRRALITPQDGAAKPKPDAKTDSKSDAKAGKSAKASKATASKTFVIKDGKVVSGNDGGLRIESVGGEDGGAMQLVIDSVVEGVDDCCEGLKEGMAELQVELGDLDVDLEGMTFELSSLGEGMAPFLLSLTDDCATDACATGAATACEDKDDDCCCCCKKNNCCKDDGKKAKSSAKAKARPKSSVWVAESPRRDGPEWKTAEGPTTLRRGLAVVAPKIAEGRNRLEGAREKVMQRLAEARKAIMSNAREDALKALDRLKHTIESLDSEQEARAVGNRATLNLDTMPPMQGMPPMPPMPPMQGMPPMPAGAPEAPKAPKAPKAQKTRKAMEFRTDSNSAHGQPSAPSRDNGPSKIERLRLTDLAEKVQDAGVKDDGMRDELEQLRRELQDLRNEIRALSQTPKDGPGEGSGQIRARRIERL